MDNLISQEGHFRIHRGWMVEPYTGCNGNCNQGRDCPVRQACEVPMAEDAPSLFAPRWFWALGAACVGAWCLVYLAARLGGVI